jgi:hypothetical protein
MKYYFILGYDECGKLTPMISDGFSELSAAIDYLATIHKSFNAFISVRLINI